MDHSLLPMYTPSHMRFPPFPTPSQPQSLPPPYTFTLHTPSHMHFFSFPLHMPHSLPPPHTLTMHTPSHRGVNMYAMLLGKLPFRSPRHGTKRRQRLLEQISAGLSETHEKEMAFLSPGAKDLLHRFLQPDPHKRVNLDAAMQHLWITNDGKQLMSPYKYTPPDAATQHRVSVCGYHSNSNCRVCGNYSNSN